MSRYKLAEYVTNRRSIELGSTQNLDQISYHMIYMVVTRLYTLIPSQLVLSPQKNWVTG